MDTIFNSMEKFYRSSTWKLVIQGIILYVSIRAIQDMGTFPIHLTKWKIFYFSIISLILLANLLLYLGFFTGQLKKYFEYLLIIPKSLRIFLGISVVVIPVIGIIFTEWGLYLNGQYLRLFIFLFSSAAAAIFIFDDKKQNISLPGFFLCIGLSAFLFSFALELTAVRTTPFSLAWSEGNRFYDYSLTFGKSLYDHQGKLEVPYNSPGRYALWGALFLIPGLPIWAHRLWDAFLWSFTPVLLGLVLTKKITNQLLRWGVILWAALFVMQGPVYPHLLVPMILLGLFIWSDRFWVKVIIGIIVSVYAGISRFTWVLLPGVWLVLIDLIAVDRFDSPFTKKRIFRSLTLGIAGVIPGMLASWSVSTANLVSSQSLLFYRLLPNATYQEGILIGIAIVSLPTIGLLSWLIVSGRWQMNKLAIVVTYLSLLGLLLMGLIASTKIGGGSNLHNLDMFLLTLILLVVIAVSQMDFHVEMKLPKIPQSILLLLFIVAILPGWAAYKGSGYSGHFDPNVETKSLKTIRVAVEEKKAQGEVLFIDQRQLLTFGYVKDVPLISEYEKKYMMDQAMGNNGQYFDHFYQDLKNKRFKLIVSDVLRTKYQPKEESFSEENNSYVKWVSRPVLDYYKPIVTIKDLGIQLLVPKE